MLGSIREFGGPQIIEGKRGEDWNEVESGKKKEMKREQKDNGGRDQKQKMLFQREGLCSSVAVVLMAGESIVDEPYYVANIMPNNSSSVVNNINKHREETTAMMRFY